MMGRVKLKIKKLENTNGRQATYAKRKHGIMKKASELSILCDIDIVLLMFSPTGKPSLCKGLRSDIAEVIGKFSELTPQERTKRKLESLEALKKTFRKVDHDVNIPELLGTRNQNIEDLSNQAKFLKNKVSEIQKRMIYWTEPAKINNIQQLERMETSLRDSLNQIRLCKKNIQKQQIMSFEYSTQFNEMHIPFGMSSEQQLQPFSWIYNTDNPHVFLPEDAKLLVNRDAEFSSSSSYESHTSYIGTGKSPEISPTAHDHALHELRRTAPLRFQLEGQLPFMPYSVELLNDCKIQPETADMNSQENPFNHYFTDSFEAPRSVYDSSHLSLASTSDHCTLTMPDEHLYAQTSFR